MNSDKLQVSVRFLRNFPKLYNKYLNDSGIFVKFLNHFSTMDVFEVKFLILLIHIQMNLNNTII